MADLIYNDEDLILSYSQINSYKDCQAKWVIERVFRKKYQGNISTAKGTLIHAIAEQLTKPGKVNIYEVLDDVAKKDRNIRPFYSDLRKWIPVAQNLLITLIDKGLLVKERDGFVSESKYASKRKKTKSSFVVTINGAIDGFGLFTNKIVIRDYKFKARKNFLLSEDEIARDLQLRMYVKFVCDNMPPDLERPNIARLSHIYLIEETGEVFEVAAEVDVDEVLKEVTEFVDGASERIAKTYASAVAEVRTKLRNRHINVSDTKKLSKEELVHAENLLPSMNLEGNLNHCEAYRGCPHKAYCPVYAKR